MAKVPVLVAASGAPWEADALERIARAGSTAVLLKRCVDLHDLLATASTGLARVALLSARLPGLDADSVARLRRSGLGLVLVADSGSPDGTRPHANRDIAGDADRSRQLGIARVLDRGDLTALVETVRLAGEDADPVPGAEPALTPGPTPEAPRPAPTPFAGTGRLVVVWGPTGAPGRTTVAVGLAAEAAHRGRDAVLVDADPYGGAVAQHLGVLDEVSGLLAAARLANAGRLDQQTLASLARQLGPHLRMLTGLPRPDRWSEVRPHAFDALLGLAGGLGEHVVVDTGFSLEHEPADPFEGGSPSRNQMSITALERADEVVVVGSADPVGLARLARGLVDLHGLLPSARPRVVVNRTRTTLGWSEKDIRGMVEGFVTPLGVHFLPEDRAAADRALMAGQSLVEGGDTALRRALAQVADASLGDVPVASRPRRRRLTRRRSAGRGFQAAP